MDFQNKEEIVREITSLMRIKQVNQEQLKTWMDGQRNICNTDIARLREFLDYLRVL